MFPVPTSLGNNLVSGHFGSVFWPGERLRLELEALVDLFRRPPRGNFRSRCCKSRVRRRQAKARDCRRWLAAAARCGSRQCGRQRLWLLAAAGCLPKAIAQQLLLQGCAVGLPCDQRVPRHSAKSWVEVDWLVPDCVSLGIR